MCSGLQQVYNCGGVKLDKDILSFWSKQLFCKYLLSSY